MRKISTFFINFIITLGIIFLAAVFIFSVVADQKTSILVMKVLPVLAVLIGIACVIVSFKLTKKAYHSFIGMFLIFWSVIGFLAVNEICTFSVSRYWPLIALTSGLFLALSGSLHYKTIKLGYILPSLFLFFIGGWLLLFTCKIIQIPFKEVILVVGPILVLLAAVFIFVLFFLQKKYKNLVLKDNDNEGSFEDDEIEEGTSFFEDEK